MATNLTHAEESWDWPHRGGAMSEEEYHELEQLNPDLRYEYINGTVYMMSGGTVEHDLIADNIRAALRSRLRSGPCNTFGENIQVLLGTKKNGRPHFVYPDTTVSCAAEDIHVGNTLVKSPKLVIEVLSPGTETKDRGVKFRAYQKCSAVQEIVLVNQYAPHVEIWQRDEQDATLWNSRYYDRGSTVHFASIDLHVKIEELYQDLYFMREEDEEYDNLEEDE
jgi:Uma2 family endonuclease